ncbi:MAG: hypothetical protein IT371_09195 [Deltaproteobacteria bacterium]|nr:hypothetical protein [Deltaproteobacteria bacterium]
MRKQAKIVMVVVLGWASGCGDAAFEATGELTRRRMDTSTYPCVIKGSGCTCAAPAWDANPSREPGGYCAYNAIWSKLCDGNCVGQTIPAWAPQGTPVAPAYVPPPAQANGCVLDSAGFVKHTCRDPYFCYENECCGNRDANWCFCVANQTGLAPAGRCVAGAVAPAPATATCDSLLGGPGLSCSTGFISGATNCPVGNGAWSYCCPKGARIENGACTFGPSQPTPQPIIPPYTPPGSSVGASWVQWVECQGTNCPVYRSFDFSAPGNNFTMTVQEQATYGKVIPAYVRKSLGGGAYRYAVSWANQGPAGNEFLFLDIGAGYGQWAFRPDLARSQVQVPSTLPAQTKRHCRVQGGCQVGYTNDLADTTTRVLDSKVDCGKWVNVLYQDSQLQKFVVSGPQDMRELQAAVMTIPMNSSDWSTDQPTAQQCDPLGQTAFGKCIYTGGVWTNCPCAPSRCPAEDAAYEKCRTDNLHVCGQGTAKDSYNGRCVCFQPKQYWSEATGCVGSNVASCTAPAPSTGPGGNPPAGGNPPSGSNGSGGNCASRGGTCVAAEYAIWFWPTCPSTMSHVDFGTCDNVGGKTMKCCK